MLILQKCDNIFQNYYVAAIEKNLFIYGYVMSRSKRYNLVEKYEQQLIHAMRQLDSETKAESEQTSVSNCRVLTQSNSNLQTKRLLQSASILQIKDAMNMSSSHCYQWHIFNYFKPKGKKKTLMRMINFMVKTQHALDDIISNPYNSSYMQRVKLSNN